MQTIFEWAGDFDLEPFGVTGDATTKTITSELTQATVLTNGYSLRFYANDANNDKNVVGSIRLPMPLLTGLRFRMDFLTPLANSAWDILGVEFNRYDGTNLSKTALRLNSNADVDNDVEVLNASAAWEDIAGQTLPAMSNVWHHFDFRVNFNATAVDPTYNYLLWNGEEITTFPDDGYNTADATSPQFYMYIIWTVQAGASAYMYVDNLKLEVF
jgi:hypothetical protein|tara:strand:- start:251 stop:892 length:642 start_codon:yes stop_codon:yes gene_type:complete